jgi:hypothetical protein
LLQSKESVQEKNLPPGDNSKRQEGMSQEEEEEGTIEGHQETEALMRGTKTEKRKKKEKRHTHMQLNEGYLC